MNKVILKFVTVCVLTANTVTALGAETVSFRDERFSTGDVYAGFEVTALRSFDYLKSDVIFLEHEKTGAEVICIDNNDTNKTFELAFKTPLEDEKGLTHVLEHAVLSGSEKYPSSTLKNKLMLQTYNTLMNGESFKYTTAYPIASASEDQLYALAEFYMDSAFNPMFPSDASVFDREAWHYELDDAESQISITGTCYNENKGLDTISNAAYDNLMKALYPDSYSGNSKYGVNKEFLAMTNDDLIDYHSKYYHPSNSLTVLYGDMDFERFLGLLDTYFSEYDKTELAIDISAHSPTESYIEEQFEYPASADDESGVYSIFAVECPGVNAKELTALEMAADIFNTDGSAVRQRLKETLPEANVTFEVSYYDSPEPLFIAVSSDLAENDAKVMAETVTDALKDGGSISDSLKNAAAASSRREKAVSFESASVGADLAYDITQSWAVGDAQLCFDMLDSDENTIADSIEETVSKYFAEPSRSALVTTVPVPGAAEKEQADLNADLTALKDSMSAEEIQALVDKTAQYKNNTQQTNDEIDNEFIEELSVVDINELPETVRDYNIQDTTVHGVRYVTSIADIEDIGKGRIMLDASGIPEDELMWLSLYQKLLGNMPTEKYTAEELPAAAQRYADCSTDIVTISSDGINGFTPYVILKYEGFGDESDMIFDIAEQILFKTDFSDTGRLKGIVDWYIGSMRTGIEQSGQSYLLMEATASGETEQAYYNSYQGLDFYDFLRGVSVMLDKAPETITEKLNDIKGVLCSRSGAMVVYAGEEDSIRANSEYAEAMFEDIPEKPMQEHDYSALVTDKLNRAMPTNLGINFNGIYAPLEVLGIDYTMKSEVIMNLVSDRYALPGLRNKYNVYGFSYTSDPNGIYMCSYRDPNVKETMDFYKGLGGSMRSDNISQDDIDRYILNTYSSFTMPRGELHDAYWAAADYTNGTTSEVKASMMHDMKSVTKDDIMTYADVFDSLYENGSIYTAGSREQIESNAELYDEIVEPFDDIIIVMDGDVFIPDTDIYIEDGVTMVPMRDIFEKLGAQVSWNGDSRTVTAVKDDKTISFAIGSNEISVSDGLYEETVNSERDIAISNDRTMIPLRLIAQLFGYEVEWNEEGQYISIV